MIKVSVLYPNKEGTHFNLDYYRDKHMQMVKDGLKPLGLLTTGIEKGLGGIEPGQPAPYHCIGTMTFETMERMQQALQQHGQGLMADIPNFTDVQPIIQVSEIVE